MVKKRLFRTDILISVLILGSGICFRSFLVPNVFLPTAQFFWAIYRVFASVNQRVYWLLLVGIVIYLAYRVIFSIPKETQDKYLTELDKPKGREQFWLETISNAIEKGEDSREFLRRQLGQLFLSASNLSALSKNGGVEKALLNVQPPLSSNLLSLFKESANEDKKRFHSAGFAFVRRMFQGLWWSRRRMAEASYKEIDTVLRSMEKYLEIDHEP